MATGYIQDYDGETLIIAAPYPGIEMELAHKNISECEVRILDGRELSAKQRNTIFALAKDITNYVSGFADRKAVVNDTLFQLQLNYVIDLSDREEIRQALTHNYCQLMGVDYFSLAQRTPDTIDMTTARGFIDWMVELCIEHGIPCSDTLLNRAEDIQRYLYACLWHRSCAICGLKNGKADVHHVDKIQAGNDRRKVNHVGRRAQPLCRLHHREQEQLGQPAFDQKYHLQSIVLDEKLCKHLGLNTKERGAA